MCVCVCVCVLSQYIHGDTQVNRLTHVHSLTTIIRKQEWSFLTSRPADSEKGVHVCTYVYNIVTLHPKMHIIMV